MAFILPRSPLNPVRSLALRIDPARKVLRAEEVHALHTAQEAIALAHAQAEQIVQQSHDIYESERQRGYEEGLEMARLEQAEHMIENVARTVDYFGKVEEKMVELVMNSVQKILEGFDARERVFMTVRSVLAVVRNQKQLILRLSPSIVDVVKGRMNELLADYPGIGYIDVVSDSRLVGDACILESEIGVVEASVEGQLVALRTAFQKVLGSRVS